MAQANAVACLFVAWALLGAAVSEAAPASLSGTVTDSAGDAVGRVQVAIRPPEGGSAVGEAETDEGGRYDVSIEESGAFDVEFSPPADLGLEDKVVRDVEVTGSTTLDVVLVPASPVTFSGIVRDAAGEPAAGISVELCDETANYRGQTTGADGRFSFERAPGEYCWRIGGGQANSSSLPTGFNLQGQPLDLSEDREVDLTIPFVPVTVRVLGEGSEPVAGAAVSLHTASFGGTPVELAPGITMTSPNAEDTAQTDAQGEALLALFDTDEATGSVRPPEGSGYANVTIPPHVIEGPTTIAIVLVQEPPIDAAAPSIEIRTPTDGGTYERGSTLVADYECADEATGSGLAACEGDVADGATVDTSSVGSFSFSVSALDNAGNLAIETVTYTVVNTPSAEIEDLIRLVEQLEGSEGIEKSLVVKLEKIAEGIETGDGGSACTLLDAFIRQVDALSGKTLPDDDADRLIEGAGGLRSSLGC